MKKSFLNLPPPPLHPTPRPTHTVLVHISELEDIITITITLSALVMELSREDGTLTKPGPCKKAQGGWILDGWAASHTRCASQGIFFFSVVMIFKNLSSCFLGFYL